MTRTWEGPARQTGPHENTAHTLSHRQGSAGTRRGRATAGRGVRIERGRRTAWITGPRVRTVLDRLGVPTMRDPDTGGWMIPAGRADEVATWLETVTGRSVVLVEVDR